MESARQQKRPVRLLLAPYDSGIAETRMGAGPLAIAPFAERRLRESGVAPSVHRLDPASTWRPEVETAFELQRLIAGEAHRAFERGEFPLLLSGNCNATLGMLAGAALSGQRRIGLIWLDGHADFNTPETTSTGFLDGQGLAMIVGRCWSQATKRVPGFSPLPEDDVVLVGARDMGALEERALNASKIIQVPPPSARQTQDLAAIISDLVQRVDAVHLHIDLDVHDPQRVAPANSYAAPDGLLTEEVRSMVPLIRARVPISSATLAAYDPEADRGARIRTAAVDLVAELVLGSQPI